VVVVIAGWGVAAAAASSAIRHRALVRFGEDPLAFLRSIPAGGR
jgi:hypothetical protein